jgi:hypothetical protein
MGYFAAETLEVPARHIEEEKRKSNDGQGVLPMTELRKASARMLLLTKLSDLNPNCLPGSSYNY